jgi:hypothetical protein
MSDDMIGNPNPNFNSPNTFSKDGDVNGADGARKRPRKNDSSDAHTLLEAAVKIAVGGNEDKNESEGEGE